jgi:TRAP-type C4-dicarboxylate transport system permease small subunit
MDSIKGLEPFKECTEMKTFFHNINQILSGFCGWLMLAMMILLVADIIGRTIGQPLQGMAELSVFVMMIVIYLGLARCEEHGEHVRLELAVNALPKVARPKIVFLSRLMAVVTVGLLLYAVFQNALTSFQNNEAIAGTVELRIWPVKVFMVVGLVFFLIQTVRHMVDAAKKTTKKD